MKSINSLLKSTEGKIKLLRIATVLAFIPVLVSLFLLRLPDICQITVFMLYVVIGTLLVSGKKLFATAILLSVISPVCFISLRVPLYSTIIYFIFICLCIMSCIYIYFLTSQKEPAKILLFLPLIFLVIGSLSFILHMLDILYTFRIGDERNTIFLLLSIPYLLFYYVLYFDNKSRFSETKQQISLADNAPIGNSNYTEIAELRKYKTMLDEGLITKKDYDKKKKQILNL